jgi:nucleotide-binding universal stress UspA family protein
MEAVQSLAQVPLKTQHHIFSKVLVCIDESDLSLRAFEHALFLQQTCGSSVTAVHVVTIPLGIYGDYAGPALKLLENLQTNGQEILTKAKELAKERNLVIATTMVEGSDPAREIIQLSEKDGYDLIILGRRRLSGIRKLLLNSMSNEVSEHAKCAVLTVG